MSASEIIEQIKALPSEERQAVVEFVRNTEWTSKEEGSEVTYVDRQNFENAAARVFETHDELFKRLAK